jgi:hypothetical protein
MTKARDLANASTALSAVSATELGYLDGVTSAVQTQLNAKQPTVANVSDTEIGYLDGVNSSIQAQLDAKVAKSGDTMSSALNVGSGNDVVQIGGGSIEISNSSYTGYIDFKNSVAEDYDVRLMQYTGGGTGLTVVPISGGTPAANALLRNITLSTSTPTGGSDGDVWIQYT